MNLFLNIQVFNSYLSLGLKDEFYAKFFHKLEIKCFSRSALNLLVPLSTLKFHFHSVLIFFLKILICLLQKMDEKVLRPTNVDSIILCQILWLLISFLLISWSQKEPDQKNSFVLGQEQRFSHVIQERHSS